MLRLLFILLLPLSFQSIDYSNVFQRDYSNALEVMKVNSGLFSEYSHKYNTDPEIIMPVLFPEAIRYSIISDFLETNSLELVYVYAGSADFSIGRFQMKPSFVENLENAIDTHPEALAKYSALLIPGDRNSPEVRKERIARLKSLNYQILYANCFFDIIKIIYPSVLKMDKVSQIKFISTAYNHGFLTGQKEIKEYSEKAFFPFNGKNNTSRYVYNEISLYFYNHDLPLILCKLE
ncbi:MAG: hypothetical protein H6540_03025 [Bacteroidales bacterium]|nr:hypothetical protein [Bacteroidales bacterium]